MYVDPRLPRQLHEDLEAELDLLSALDEQHLLALKSVARWAMRDDLSVERRLAAIRRVTHVALSDG